MNYYQRIFGSGPLGALISVLLLGAAAILANQFEGLKITSSEPLRLAVFGALLAITLLIVAWSLRSLPPGERGHRLATSGAFKYFRHPLYGAFLSFFNFGLAVFLNNWVYVGWALAQHPVWHWNVRGEEAFVAKQFPGEYEAYAARTGRFFPRLWTR